MIQKTKPGFSIIEVVIGLMISSILLTVSLTVYNQISKSCTKIQNTTSQDLAIMILQKRMSDDLLGLCPLWFTGNDIKTIINTKNNEQKNQSIQENNYFYALTKNEQLDLMTFVSSNTLQTYPEPEHYIARIVYILKEDQNKENFFILQRKEESQISNEFDVEKIRDGKFYTVIDHIKKCKLEYGFMPTKNEVNQKKLNFTWVKEWSDQQKEKELEKKSAENKDSIPKLPNIIRITITLQEMIETPEVEHVFYCLIPQNKNTPIKSLAKVRNEKEYAAQEGRLSSFDKVKNNIEQRAKSAQGRANA